MCRPANTGDILGGGPDVTIAICCTLADGVVLGTDSAITLTGAFATPQGPQVGILKVYNDADKLFAFYSDAQKDDRLPIGLVTFGLATLGNRTLQSYMREFELKHKASDLKKLSVEKFCRALYEFFRKPYVESVRATLLAQKKKFEDVPSEQLPALGFFVGGFSPDDPLPESWRVGVSLDEASAVSRLRAPGDFGSNWGGEFHGVQRFHKGYDQQLLGTVVQNLFAEFKVDVSSPDAQKRMNDVLNRILPAFEYQVPFAAMPLQEGIDYTTFLLDLMILQHRFVVGAPTCGGSVRIAVVRKHEGFEWVNGPQFQVKGSRYV
jgi:hypothetical protein